MMSDISIQTWDHSVWKAANAVPFIGLFVNYTIFLSLESLGKSKSGTEEYKPLQKKTHQLQKDFQTSNYIRKTAQAVMLVFFAIKVHWIFLVLACIDINFQWTLPPISNDSPPNWRRTTTVKLIFT